MSNSAGFTDNRVENSNASDKRILSTWTDTFVIYRVVSHYPHTTECIFQIEYKKKNNDQWYRLKRITKDQADNLIMANKKFETKVKHDYADAMLDSPGETGYMD